jgi:50S ribosomal protein L16 3-hydroxylase
MVSRWADRLLEIIDPEIFFQDPASEVVAPTRAGEIRPEDMARARTQIRAALDKAADNHWLGELVTEPRYDIEIHPGEIARARKIMAQGPALIALSPAARVAWQQEAGGVTVYTNGQACQFDQSVLGCITELCARWRLEGEDLARAMARPTDLRLLEYLLENGGIYVE